MIKVIIFDFGGVILRHKTTLIKNILIQMFPGAYHEADAIWEKNQLNLSLGKMTSDQFIFKLKNNIQTEHSLDTLKQKWSELYKKEADNVNWVLLNFIEKLKKNYKVYLFTDTIDVHDEHNKTRNIYTHFHKVYKSFEEGVAKVEGIKAYQYILKKIGVKPYECVFIDDVEKNVKIAEKIGIKGIVYKSLSQLKEELQFRGIKI